MREFDLIPCRRCIARHGEKIKRISAIYRLDISCRYGEEGGRDVSIERQPTSGWLSFVKAVSLRARFKLQARKKNPCQLLEFNVDIAVQI